MRAATRRFPSQPPTVAAIQSRSFALIRRLKPPEAVAAQSPRSLPLSSGACGPMPVKAKPLMGRTRGDPQGEHGCLIMAASSAGHETTATGKWTEPGVPHKGILAVLEAAL